MIVPIEKPLLDELVIHSGVKGMHWGIRKKEETSGRESSKSKSVQKSGPIRQNLIKFHKSEVKSQQRRIDYVKAHPSKWTYIQNQNNKEVRQREKIRDQHLKDIKNLEEGKLTDFQKKALIGAGIAATVLVAYGAYRLHDTRARRFIQEGDKIIGIPFKRNDALSRKMTSKQLMDEVVSKVNPGQGRIPGRSDNCLRCSFAYELRRRGYDVEATSTTRGGFEQTAYGVVRALNGLGGKVPTPTNPLGEHEISIFRTNQDALDIVGNKSESARTVSSHIFEALSQHEEGARGELGVSWKLGGAHSVAWEIVGGKPHIFDTQLGKHFTSPEDFLDYAKEITAASFTRLDNIDLDENFLNREWIQNVK